MDAERAAQYIIHCLVDPSRGRRYEMYGYEVYLPRLLDTYFQQEEPLEGQERYKREPEVSTVFRDAAWDLCRRGILRPGIWTVNEQVTDDGSGGNGYSITAYGRAWIAESSSNNFVPTEPGRFAALLKPFQEKFGAGFFKRAQEAIKCYRAGAHLACCAMCGAAAESILLAIAVRRKNEEDVLKIYASAGGRSRVEKFVIGKSREQLQRRFHGYCDLLYYWRDEAAHGRASSISDDEAYVALQSVLRFAQFANEYWEDLTNS